MNAPNPQPVTSGHIEIRTTRSGAYKAYIAGTRISVENIYVCHELQGLSPDEIVMAYPHLTLAQIHSALAYYFEHADEIREQLRESEEFAERMADAQGPTRYTQLRDALRNDSP
ncbi:MAG: DUF433 domain-containing protein [Planctomycetaceae bacterium]